MKAPAFLSLLCRPFSVLLTPTYNIDRIVVGKINQSFAQPITSLDVIGQKNNLSGLGLWLFLGKKISYFLPNNVIHVIGRCKEVA